jgi:hypothetical protein
MTKWIRPGGVVLYMIISNHPLSLKSTASYLLRARIVTSSLHDTFSYVQSLERVVHFVRPAGGESRGLELSEVYKFIVDPTMARI